MDNAGSDVILTVCSKFLSLKNLETNEIIVKYDMPRISFASGGDTVSGERAVPPVCLLEANLY